MKPDAMEDTEPAIREWRKDADGQGSQEDKAGGAGELDKDVSP